MDNKITDLLIRLLCRESEEEVKEKIRERRKQRIEEVRLVRKIVFIFIFSFILVFGGTTMFGFVYIKSALEPVNTMDITPVSIEIPYGSGTSSIANILEGEGIVKNATVYKYYLKFNNESEFQAGTYELTPAMTLEQITNILKGQSDFFQ